MTGYLHDDSEADDLTDMECCHGGLDYPMPTGEGACGSTEFDLVYGDKGVIEATCKKCGSKYRLTPSNYYVEEIKTSKRRRLS